MIAAARARISRLRLVLAMLGLAMILLGCASRAGAPKASAAPKSGEHGDIATASDETELQRRAHIRLELASTYYAQGQYSTALDEIKLALSLSPNLSEAHEMRGLIYESLGDPERADASFDRALEIDPNNASALHNYAWTLCQRGNYGRAEALFERALAQPRGIPSARVNLARGVCLTRAGKLDAALDALQQSYQLDSGNAATGYNLADVLYRKGEYDRARFYIARVNATPDQVTAESLWLAIRIENKMGDVPSRNELADQLHNRFAGSREATKLDSGRFDE